MDLVSKYFIGGLDMATMSFRHEELEMLHKCLLLARHTALTRYKKEKMSLDEYVRLDTQIGILIDRIWEVLH